MTSYIKQFSIRDTTFSPNVYVSSMSGVSDVAFRTLVKRLADGRVSLSVSEFVSVESARGNIDPKSTRQLRFNPEEHPFCIQLFGYEPAHMAKAAKAAQELGADYVEINVGCPAPKVVGKGGGAGLLKNLPLLEEILLRVKEVIDVPLLVKARVGWCENSINALETLDIVERSGGECFTLHGRNRLQGYRGEADWGIIRQVAEAGTIPIIGNGDIRGPQDAIQRLTESGCDGVCVGRGVMHNPWIMAQVADVWEGKEMRWPTMDEQVGMFHLYNDLLSAEYSNELSALGRVKQLTARFCNSLIDEKELRNSILRAEDTKTFFKNLETYYARAHSEGHEIQYRPDLVINLNGTKDKEIKSGNDYN